MKIACGWLYVLNRYGYPADFASTLAAIASVRELGFEAFELEAVGEENLRLFYAQRRQLARHIDDLGLRVANLVPTLPSLINEEGTRQERTLGAFALGCELAAFLKAEMLVSDSYQTPMKYLGEEPGKNRITFGRSFRVQVTPEFSWDRVWHTVVEWVGRCVEIARQCGLPLALEMRVGDTVSNTDAFLRLHQAIGSTNLGAVLDTAHLHAQKEILALSVEKLGRRVFLVHASDNDSLTNQHLALGQGTIDWPSFYAALRKHGYVGSTVLDIGDGPDLDAAYVSSRKYLEERVGQEGTT